MHAMPLLLGILCIFAIAYRYYSAFLAAKVAALDDSVPTPAVMLDDGQNYHPTSKWVLFGHHFAAISGAGPLIGPVLAAQFGYLPGLLWIVIGVCLAGAVQDFLVLAASIQRGGKSLARMAYDEIGPTAGRTAMVAILFIIVIALAGLGKVVVKALGGEQVKYPAGSVLVLPQEMIWPEPIRRGGMYVYDFPSPTELHFPDGIVQFSEAITLADPAPLKGSLAEDLAPNKVYLSANTVRQTTGSPWGVFTIACTIPIALFVGVYMFRLRKGAVVEASLIGGALTLGATVAGGWIATHPIGQMFNLTDVQVTWAMAIYGAAAAILPVWVLLTPRDYLSSFLKIGTIGVLVVGTLIANPLLQAPAINHVFLHEGPTVRGSVFPFLFITIMCGAISGFHALVSSGTTPKMIMRARDARTIGYGAMLLEGLVGVVAALAAASLSPRDFYAMNTPLADAPGWQTRILQVGGGGGLEHIGQYEQLTQESLRGRTGGAVTLAVGMAKIFHEAFHAADWLWKYWYHFAIMFEALFILTTIDAGTRVGRYLLQELTGDTQSLLSSVTCTLAIVLGWTYFMQSGSFDAIWAMFGVANQMLSVIALIIISVVLMNTGKGKYVWVTLLPMMFVATTTTSAALELLTRHVTTLRTQWGNVPEKRNAVLMSNAAISGGLIIAMLGCTGVIGVMGGRKSMKGEGLK